MTLWQRVTSVLKTSLGLSSDKSNSGLSRIQDAKHAVRKWDARPAPRFHGEPFKELDSVLVKIRGSQDRGILKLRHGLSHSHTHSRGTAAIPHSSIIGKKPGDMIDIAPQVQIQAQLQTLSLGDYISILKPIGTPIYPSDARFLVDLFDLRSIHLSPDAAPGTINILEAGTGTGSLTLHLAMAIDHLNRGYSHARDFPAVVDTVERDSDQAKAARQNVRGFARGIYRDNVRMHTDDIGSYLTKRCAEEASTGRVEFITHAFLDLLSAEKHLSMVAATMVPGARLIVFYVQVAQILKGMKEVASNGLPLTLDRVIELPTNAGTGGREWDFRLVKPRQSARDQDDDSPPASGDFDFVSRPKVGGRVVGGGFVAIYYKTPKAGNASGN